MEASKSEEKIYYVSSKSRITAILLCCLGFLGLGGFHRLYMKKWMTGLLYLMTFGLFFLGTAYDLHQLIVERFKDTDGFPLYSDGSMRQNYRRRRPKGRTPVGIKIVVPLALLAFALNLATMSQHEAAYQQQKAQQQAEQQRQKEQADAAKEKREGAAVRTGTRGKFQDGLSRWELPGGRRCARCAAEELSGFVVHRDARKGLSRFSCQDAGGANASKSRAETAASGSSGARRCVQQYDVADFHVCRI